MERQYFGLEIRCSGPEMAKQGAAELNTFQTRSGQWFLMAIINIKGACSAVFKPSWGDWAHAA